jgi:hypothetical protein
LASLPSQASACKVTRFQPPTERKRFGEPVTIDCLRNHFCGLEIYCTWVCLRAEKYTIWLFNIAMENHHA